MFVGASTHVCQTAKTTADKILPFNNTWHTCVANCMHPIPTAMKLPQFWCSLIAFQYFWIVERCFHTVFIHIPLEFLVSMHHILLYIVRHTVLTQLCSIFEISTFQYHLFYKLFVVCPCTIWWTFPMFYSKVVSCSWDLHVG